MPAENSAERVLGNSCHLTDEIELIIVQPLAQTGIELGQHLERMRSEKTSLIPCWDIEQLLFPFPASPP